jgi:hypothetical protein
MEGRMPKPRVTTRGKEGGKEKGRFHKRDVYLSSLSRSLSLNININNNNNNNNNCSNILNSGESVLSKRNKSNSSN